MILIDTGGSVSLKRIDLYNRLRMREYLQKMNLVNRQAVGRDMMIRGMIWLPIKVGVTANHKLYVAFNVSSELLISEDWLRVQKVLLPLMAKWDIKLPGRIGVSCRRRIATKKLKNR